MRCVTLTAIPFTLVAVMGCGGRQGATPAGDRSEVSTEVVTKPAPPPVQGKTMRFRMQGVSDDPTVGIGGEAFRVLVPEGWVSEGGIVWRAHPAAPATLSIRFSNPAGPEELIVLPNLYFTWVDGGMPFFPVGSLYLGNEVRPPIHGPAEYVSDVIVPRLRPGLRQATIAGHEDLPGLAQVIASAQPQQPGLRVAVRAGKTRFEYAERGRSIQEDVYAVLTYTTSMGGTIWGTDRAFVFKAEKGRLDDAARVFHAMIASVQLDLKWFNRYQQLVQMLVQSQMQAIQRAGELSRYIARTNNEISDMIRQSWQQRQAAEDRIYSNFSQYIRGVEVYQNPFDDRAVELPSGYGEVWANRSGEYILSESPNFDPNVGSPAEWRRLPKARQ